MPTSAFLDTPKPPPPEALARALGRSHRLWDQLRTAAASGSAAPSEVWKHFPKAGWVLLLKSRARTLLYVFPGAKHFAITVVLGPRAVAAAEAAGLPGDVLAALRAARQYPEGRPVTREVRTRADLAAVLQLLDLKRRY